MSISDKFIGPINSIKGGVSHIEEYFKDCGNQYDSESDDFRMRLVEVEEAVWKMIEWLNQQEPWCPTAGGIKPPPPKREQKLNFPDMRGKKVRVKDIEDSIASPFEGDENDVDARKYIGKEGTAKSTKKDGTLEPWEEQSYLVTFEDGKIGCFQDNELEIVE